MSMTVVANPTSGRGRALRSLPIVTSTLEAAGFEPHVVVTRDGDEVRGTVRAARAAGADRVIVVGGDGTLHLAIQELAGGDTALGIVPSGTGDDNARTLGIPRKDPRAATLLAATGVITRIDLGEVRCHDGGSAVFLGVLSSGFDSLVNERANQMTRPRGDARYLVAILAELRTFHPIPYIARVDDRAVAGEAMLVAVGNGASYGGGMRVCPDAKVDDGLLEVTWLHGVSKGTFLRVFPQVFQGGHVRSRHVSTVRARTIALDAPGQLVYADGERIGDLPAVIEIRPGALAVARGA